MELRFQEVWEYAPTPALRFVVARARAEAAHCGAEPGPEQLLLALLDAATLSEEALVAAGCDPCDAPALCEELAYVPWLLGDWGADVRTLCETCRQEFDCPSVQGEEGQQRRDIQQGSESYRALLAYARTGAMEHISPADRFCIVLHAQLSVSTAFDDLLGYPTPQIQAAFVRYEELYDVEPWSED